MTVEFVKKHAEESKDKIFLSDIKVGQVFVFDDEEEGEIHHNIKTSETEFYDFEYETTYDIKHFDSNSLFKYKMTATVEKE